MKAMKAGPADDREENRYDLLAIRCPRLGGQVTFAYCRREAGTLPCQRTVICWQHRFPVEVFLETVMKDEDLARWRNQSPKDKIVNLLELIEDARERLGGEDAPDKVT